MLNIFEGNEHMAFISDETRKISFQKFIEDISTLSFPDYFLEQKYIAVISKNNYEFILSVAALWEVGLIPVPINYNLKVEQISQMLKSINCNAALVESCFYSEFRNVCSSVFTFKDLEKSSNKKIISFNETAVVLFTSGSTDLPKAVPLTFSNFLHHFDFVKNIFNLFETDNWLASLPFYHIGGFAIILRTLISKSSLSIIPNFGSDQIIPSIEKFNPSHISLVPTQLYEIVKKSILPNVDHKYLFLGGGPSEESIVLSAINLGWNIIKVYGSTETCSMVASVNINEFPSKIKSSGKAFVDHSILIVDNKLQELSNNDLGQIAVKAESLTSGYIKIDSNQFSNGMFFTGDFGFLDEDGFLFIEMRREDLIISGGENINPTEIELAIKKLKYVKDCVVVGLEDVKWGQIICAVVHASHVILESELQEELKQYLPSFKIPKKIIFLDNIARNEIGKINRNSVKKLFVQS